MAVKCFGVKDLQKFRLPTPDSLLPRGLGCVKCLRVSELTLCRVVAASPGLIPVSRAPGAYLFLPLPLAPLPARCFSEPTMNAFRRSLASACALASILWDLANSLWALAKGADHRDRAQERILDLLQPFSEFLDVPLDFLEIHHELSPIRR